MSDPPQAHDAIRQYDYWSDKTVVVLPWPVDDDALAGDERARLYIVAEGSAPPARWSDDEDWLRAPVCRLELDARRDRLRRRVAARVPIDLDEYGLVRRGDRWVAVSAAEAAVLEPLLRHEDELVTRSSLAAAGPWGVDDDRRLLDGTMARLRRRLRPLGITIHTVRSAGYLLERDVPPD